MNNRFGILLLVLVNALWGSTYAVAKVAMTTLPPTLLACYRVLLATLLLWLIQGWLAYRHRNQVDAIKLPAMPLRDKMRLAALGVLGVGLAFVIDYIGVNLTTATDASLMIIGEVIFTALLAAWWLKEGLNTWRIVGIGLGALGVTIIVMGHVAQPDSSGGIARAIGDLLILVALLAQAIYTVLGTDLARKYPPFTVLTYAYSGSLLIWFPILGWHLWAGDLATPLSWPAIFGIVYLGLIGSVFCYFIWFSIASQIGAGLSALSLFVQPVVGSLIGLLILQDALTTSLLIGAGFIFIALYLTTITGPTPVPDVPPA